VVLIRRATPLLPENQHATFVKIVNARFAAAQNDAELLRETGRRTTGSRICTLEIPPQERAEK